MVDNRSFPFSAIGIVSETIGGVAGHGSGVLIAPDEFLTAAHVVWTQGVGSASSVQVFPGLNGSDQPFGGITVDRFHYVSISNPGNVLLAPATEQDFALLHLSSPVPGAGTMSLSANYAGGVVHLTGYPDSAGTTTEVDATALAPPDANTATFNLGGLGAGGSGGPLWLGGTGSATVVGAMSSLGRSSELSTPIVSLLNSWVAEDHAAGAHPSGGIAVAPIDIHHVASSLNAATVFGGLGGDTITGSGAGQWLVAGIGNERLVATGTNSIIFGGSGADTLVGTGSGTFMLAGSGAHRLISGAGVQGLAGGASADVFEIGGAGHGTNFAAIYSFGAGDRVELHALAGSPIDTPAEAEALQLGDGANSFCYLGDNAAGAFWLIVVGTPHMDASRISFV